SSTWCAPITTWNFSPLEGPPNPAGRRDSRVAPSNAEPASCVRKCGLDHDEFGSSRSKLINVIDSNILARDSREKPVFTFSHPALALEAESQALQLAAFMQALAPGRDDARIAADPGP